MKTDVPCFATIAQLIFYHFQYRPDAIAIAAPNQLPLTYADFYKQIQQTVHQLNELGIDRGDRIAIVLPNGPEMAVVFLAVAAIAISAPLNPAYQESEFDFYLSDLKVRAVIVLAGMASPVRESAAKQQIPVLELVPQTESAGLFHLTGTLESSAIAPTDACPEDIALILHTSGTTSRPKMVPLTQANLCYSAQTIQATLALTPSDRSLNIMPLFHIHGLVGVLLSSLAGGGCVICSPGFIADEFFNWWATEHLTWYSAVPTLHQAILDKAESHQDVIAQSPLRFIRSSSASLPPLVLKQLEQTFNVPVIEAYGMTEAAHQIASNPLPPAKRCPGSVGLATSTEVAIMDEQGNLMPSGEIGEVVIRGRSITQGYLNNPEANANAFCKGWFRTGDRGYLNEQGYLFLRGRLKEIINRGGEKVAPQEIDEVLMEYPGVLQAVTFAVPHPTLGEDVAAAVVPKQGVSLSNVMLRQWLFQRLVAYKVPSQVIVVETIPKGATGKLQRIGLAEKLADVLVQPYCPPRNEIEQSIAVIMTEVLRIEQISIFDNFFSLGGDSLTGSQVVTRVCDRFQITIAPTHLFTYPTIAELASALESLKAQGFQTQKPKILSRLRKTVNIEDEVYFFPVSFAQQRLWFLDQLEGPSATYTNASARSLQGTLNIPALEQAIQTLVQRHETLRTTFRMIDNALMQIIRPSLTLLIPRIDLTQLSPEEQSHQVQSLIQEFSQHIFNLETGPLIRVSLAKLSAENHVLLLAMHHIITDGWSTQVFWQEFCALYHAFSQGQPSPLADLPIQYADYTVWQQEWLQGEVFANQLAYWKQQLGGELPILQLPIDRPRPLVQTYNGSQQTITIAADVTQALKSLSQTANPTLFMTLLAAFQTLLHRYSGQTDIIVGTPIAGRNPVETEPLIGFFANTLALRTDLTGNPTFRQLVERVREVALGAYSHADIPFEKLVEELRPQRDPSRSPLFQVMFSLKNFAPSGIDLPGLEVETMPLTQKIAKFDLSLTVQEAAEGLITGFEYNTDLFDDATITRMLGHWQMLLNGIVSNPDQPIGQLPLLTEAERHQILVEWNDTAADYPKDKCIHQLFEEQVERTSEAIAVVFEDKEITYRDLNVRANQLAHYLQGLGVGPEVLVGICLERSTEIFIALLAVLKAGGAYLPLDPTYPEARIAFMVEDAQLSILLTQQSLADQFADQAGQVIYIDKDWPTIAQHCTNNPNIDVKPDNLAYTIYTSGSMGKPKGVQICHQSVVNFLNSMQQSPGLTAQDVLLAVTTISFDIAVLELYLPLIVGAQVVLADREVAADATQLLALLVQSEATVLKATPATWRMLIAGGWQGQSQLKMLCGGEALSRELADQLLVRGGSLWNTYGPTETTVSSAACKVTSGQGPVSIAGPIANTQIYLLDQHLQPVPIGVPGEIYIGGAGLARGYLNQPELTTERFIRDPFSDRSDARLYKTGDLARYLSDGNIEFLGRIDYQVKIRGFRIELGEIEVALTQHPQVKEVVVIAREDQPGEKYLAAYIIPNQHQVPSPDALRQFLQQKLPNYMVPSIFVFLDVIPLTPNGKVDRHALPKPAWEQPSQTLELPHNRIEQEIALIWAEVLPLKQFGIYHNFFELGGHSLIVLQVISRVRNRLHLDVPLRYLFEHPTVAELAGAIGSLKAGNLQEVPKISARRREAKQIHLG